MRIKPATPGTIIRDPHTRTPLPDEGADVEDSLFWQRRIRSGDVVLVGGVAPAAPAPVAPLRHQPIAPLTTRSDPAKE